MMDCTSAYNFLREVSFARQQLKKVLDARMPTTSYRPIVGHVAEVLSNACEDFGRGPACDTYQNDYEKACDALASVRVALQRTRLDMPALSQAYEDLLQCGAVS